MSENQFRELPEEISAEFNKKAIESEQALFDLIKDKTPEEIITRLRWAIRDLQKRRDTEVYFLSLDHREVVQKMGNQIANSKK